MIKVNQITNSAFIDILKRRPELEGRKISVKSMGGAVFVIRGADFQDMDADAIKKINNCDAAVK